MIDFPRNMLEFQDWFGTENDCAAYLYDCRWPEGFVCPRCGHDNAYRLKTRRVLKCKGCGHQTSLTAGTVMHRSKMSLRRWFLAAYLVTTTTPGISAVQLQRQLGLRNYETAFNMLHKLRAAMVRPDKDKIHGIVEVDETMISAKKPGKRGRGALGKVIVTGAVEVRDNPRDGTMAGRLRLRIVPDFSARSLIGFVQRNVETDSYIVTDDFPSYTKLPKHGYGHHVADPDKMIHIHRTFGNLKSWLIGTHHGVSKKHLQAYLNEFVFRHNRRYNPMKTFRTILGLATHLQAPTYKELYEVGKERGWTHPNPWG